MAYERFDPPDGPWQYRVLDALPPGVDLTLIREDLLLTPTQRLQKLQKLKNFTVELLRSHGRDR